MQPCTSLLWHFYPKQTSSVSVCYVAVYRSTDRHNTQQCSSMPPTAQPPTHSAITQVSDSQLSPIETGWQVLCDATLNTLTVAQLLKTFTAFHATDAFYFNYNIHIPSQMCPIHTHDTFTMYILMLRSKWQIHPSTPARTFFSFSYTFRLPMHATFPPPLIHLSNCWTLQSVPNIRTADRCNQYNFVNGVAFFHVLCVLKYKFKLTLAHHVQWMYKTITSIQYYTAQFIVYTNIYFTQPNTISI
jgi:hypothetical protein